MFVSAGMVTATAVTAAVVIPVTTAAGVLLFPASRGVASTGINRINV